VWDRLRAYLDALPHDHLLLVGGGPAADFIRQMDALHHLGEEKAHWLAIYALAVTARLAARALPRARLVGALNGCAAVWSAGQTPILDPLPFLRLDESHPEHLPHTWEVTSDSIAARVAHLARARALHLLKSRPAPAFPSWAEAAAAGLVDPWFPRLAPLLAETTIIGLWNFRAWAPPVAVRREAP
jgi:aspartokinase-like uncharacterized kinase